MTNAGSDGRFLEAASRAGDELCQQAFWHEDQCNWIGRSLDEIDDETQLITPMSTAIGPDLYGGTAGIGIVLAQLFASTGEPEHRRAALGAIRRSLAHAPAADPAQMGLYSGLGGIAYAAARAGWLLDDQSLMSEGIEHARRLVSIPSQPSQDGLPLDIIAGCAGVLLALVALHRLPGANDLLEGVTGFAEYLYDRAEQDGEVWKWHEGTDSTAMVGSEPLNGYSHGASGIGVALFEAYAATGDPRWLDAGRGAFAYESLSFSPERDNWPDLRDWVQQMAPGDDEAAWGAAWCHGAPGVGLARARALNVAPPPHQSILHDLEAAARSTRAELARRASDPRLDATLCHGTTGLIDALLVVGQALDRPELVEDARSHARTLISAREAAGGWTGGTPSGGPNPSLMLGTAGVAYTLLRADDPRRVPSLLSVTPWIP